MLAPMDKVAGGALAAAVSQAGGLGMIGGGYGDKKWLEGAFRDAGNASVGAGFITWSVQKNPQALVTLFDRNPRALMVSFGDAEDIIAEAQARQIPTIWQVQRLEQAEQALRAGVDVIVAQGQEGGGHGMDRGLMALLPAVRDLAGPETIVLGAGGIADGRGLAAALMLGADGVMLGTRFWAAKEAIGPDAAKVALVQTAGDDTIRSKVFDVLRGVDWPWYYTGRVARNSLLEKWHDRIADLAADPSAERDRYDASPADDMSTRVLIAGESVDLIHSIEPAAMIVERISAEAEEHLSHPSRLELS